ncbi:TPA: MarR family winged helix-turn-helix transcriptional regulator [Legionella pneumophila]|uniref:Regulator of autolytic activity n=2 Tax=Legionellaceae TaxID=444 RepID=A0A377GBE0_9GAMM|nr:MULTISPECIES: MarR family transcriptional regulator [Legionellaceae]HAT9631459.1 MarR family transcriptional regulator [Legionella pneumophila subsp. pneumophila]KTC90446.1 MarR family transporter transcriptional regulator [Fluoribacter dumoffii NY 23]KTD68948.1 MarR family transporter transcriptional regulator [Legionella steelei]MCW8483210.1 MarR family transcriptional regulator [Fluoribacter dumoffii]STO21949.1 Regulator of autolytic activity [Fluoribacter dumoffii]
MTFNLNEHTGVLIKKAARLFERVSNLNLEELGVTYSQTIFLVRLWERDGQTQMELTKSAGLKQPTVAGILDKMERDQLIIRVRSEQDKRCYHFFLTEKAKHACRELEKQGILMQNLSAGNLPDKEVSQLNENLLSIIENLERFIENIQG